METFHLFEEYPNYAVSSEGYMLRIRPGRGTYIFSPVKGAKRNDGYLQVFGFEPFSLMHQVVIYVFLGKIGENQEVNHKNGNRSDNRIENLEYVTRSQNIKDNWDRASEDLRNHRVKKCGENARLTKSQDVRDKISKSQKLRYLTKGVE